MNTVTLFGRHYRPPRTDSASDGSEPAPPPSPPGSAEAGSRCRDPAGQRVLGRLAHWPGGTGEQGADALLPGDAAAAPINERDGHIERGIQGPDQAAGVVAPGGTKLVQRPGDDFGCGNPGRVDQRGYTRQEHARLAALEREQGQAELVGEPAGSEREVAGRRMLVYVAAGLCKGARCPQPRPANWRRSCG